MEVALLRSSSVLCKGQVGIEIQTSGPFFCDFEVLVFSPLLLCEKCREAKGGS